MILLMGGNCVLITNRICRKTVIGKMYLRLISVLKFENQLVVCMLCFVELPDAFSVFLLVVLIVSIFQFPYLGKTIPENLPNIVNHTVQHPLDIYLDFAS